MGAPKGVAVVPAYNLTEIPAYGLSYGPDVDANRDKAWWSGRDGVAVPPAIDARVWVRINSMGYGKVKGYFVESGYLGVYVELEKPPLWWANPNGYAMVFGVEMQSARPKKQEQQKQEQQKQEQQKQEVS